MKWVLLVATGCLSQPSTRGHQPDGGNTDGTASCAPTLIDLPGVGPSDAVTSPWLSDDRATLWFTLSLGGSGNGMIVRARLIANQWTQDPPLLADPSISYGDPFLSDDGMKLWFDQRPISGSVVITELDLDSGVPVQHPELGVVLQPSPTVGDTTLYFANETPALMSASRPGPAGSFGTPVLLNQVVGFDHLASPSIAGDGASIYATDRTPDDHVIECGLGGTTLQICHPVGAFQLTGHTYFDPSVSRDGRTMAFASDLAGTGQPKLYTIPLDCN